VDGKGKVEFFTNDQLWAFLKATKGTNFEYNGGRIFFSIDKTFDETILSTKVARAVKIIKTHLNTNGVNEDDLKKWFEAEYNLGMVYLRQSLAGPSDL
jgi:hypothetical protein